MNPLKCHERKDPVDRMISDCTAAEFVEWMVEHKGLPTYEADNVECNLREQFKWHRLQGRLDRSPLAAIIAELLGMRSSVKKLERPTDQEKKP